LPSASPDDGATLHLGARSGELVIRLSAKARSLLEARAVEVLPWCEELSGVGSGGRILIRNALPRVRSFRVKRRAGR
jgi:hypothetical protein